MRHRVADVIVYEEGGKGHKEEQKLERCLVEELNEGKEKKIWKINQEKDKERSREEERHNMRGKRGNIGVA